MHIHEPWHDDLACCIDDLVPIFLKMLANRGDLVSDQQQIRPFDDPELTSANGGVHGEDERCVLNQRAGLVDLAQLSIKVHKSYDAANLLCYNNLRLPGMSPSFPS